MKKRYQRKPANQYTCLCGQPAVKWQNGGFGCKRCIEIESDKGYNRDFAGLRPTLETLKLTSPV